MSQICVMLCDQVCDVWVCDPVVLCTQPLEPPLWLLCGAVKMMEACFARVFPGGLAHRPVGRELTQLSLPHPQDPPRG